MTPLEAAQAVVDQLDELKRQIEAAPRVDNLTWQYASGQVAGARLVLRAIRESGGSFLNSAAARSTEIAASEGRGNAGPPVLNKSGGSAVPYVCACAANGARDGQHFAGCPNEAKPERGKPLWEP